MKILLYLAGITLWAAGSAISQDYVPSGQGTGSYESELTRSLKAKRDQLLKEEIEAKEQYRDFLRNRTIPLSNGRRALKSKEGGFVYLDQVELRESITRIDKEAKKLDYGWLFRPANLANAARDFNASVSFKSPNQYTLLVVNVVGKATADELSVVKRAIAVTNRKLTGVEFAMNEYEVICVVVAELGDFDSDRFMNMRGEIENAVDSIVEAEKALVQTLQGK